MADESIWKKEISFGRKRKDGGDGGDAEAQRADEPTSIWKKEISFGRKKNAQPEPVADEPAAEEPLADEPAEDEEPAWTRAVSFGRKAAPSPDESGHAQGTVPEPGPEEPVVEEATWTHAVSFGRTAEPTPEPVTDETEQPGAPAAEATPEEPVVEEATWTRAVSFGRTRDPEPATELLAHVDGVPVSEPVAAAPEPVVDEPAAVADESEHVEGSVPEAGLEEPVVEETAWTRAVSFGRTAEPEEPAHADGVPVSEPVVVAPEPVVAEPAVVADEPGHVEGSVAEAGSEEPVVEETAWTRAVSLSPTREPEPATEVPAHVDGVPVSEPVAAAPEPAADEPVAEPVAEEATWTRAVSFGRTAEPEEPSHVDGVPVSEPVAAAPEPQTVAPEEPAIDGKKVPFWKKEIGGKKKDKTPKQKVAPVATASPAPEPELEKKVPFWKKEIGGKKKDKASKQKVAAAAAVAVVAEASAPEPVEKSVPFWKKELGGKKKDKQPKADKAAKAPKEPKPKKQKEPKQPKVKAARGSRGAKKITGLKIGASQLAAARVANNGSAELLQVARTPLEPGIVVGGELRDPDALAEALKEFFAKNNLPKKGVRLGIANNRIGVRTFDIAGIDDDKQLTNAIRFRAQETLPIPIDEAVLDYQVLGDGRTEDGQPTKRVLLVVAYRDLIDRYVDACKKAGISLVGIDLEAFALLRALHAPQEAVDADADAALVAVAIGHDRSTFAVSDGRICEFTRVLEWGGSALNVAIARALDAAPSEVDGVKRALALTDEMVPEGLTPEQAQKARDAMRRAIQTFARELVSSLQYYQNQPGSLGIGEIVLTGGTAHLAGLAGELERLIGVRVRVGDPLARMKVSKKVGEAEQVGSLAVAIGLGIED
jgi:type IV pilus assembly protein PilM